MATTTQRAKMMAGYAYELESGQAWRTAEDDFWEITTQGGGMADVLGRRTIDGAPVNVFKRGATVYAQTGAPIGKPKKAASKKAPKKKTASKTAAAPTEIMTSQQAYDWLTGHGFRPVPGSSRFQNAAGDTGRIEGAPDQRGSFRGDTWRVTIERKAKTPRKTTAKRPANGGSVWERQGREHGAHHAINSTDVGWDRIVAQGGGSSFGAEGLDADAIGVPDSYRARYLDAWRSGALDKALDLKGEKASRSRGKSEREKRFEREGQIRLTYAATRQGGAWVPRTWKNGVLHRSGHPGWRGLSKDEAVAMAKKYAEEEAAMYGGDWDITIAARPGSG